jgi:glycolate oxidase FAD binding subunit
MGHAAEQLEDQLASLQDAVRAAGARRTPLRLRGGGTKDFLGHAPSGAVLDTRGHRGVVAYEPTELVVVARCGTPLAELESLLADHGQMLAFEPPHFGAGATVGGCVAAGLAGPRRAAAGSLRDFVLGAKLVDGRGEHLSFGGTVMKNVAGYDVARVLAGSMGILGLITEVAIKVLPRPAAETTLRFEFDQAAALRHLNQWGGQPLPISASAWEAGVLHLRLSGAALAVAAARTRLGGEDLGPATDFWAALREQTAPFFAASTPLWRLALPSTTPPLELHDPLLAEWGGAQRWLRSAAPAEEIHAATRGLGGHATLFRGGDRAAAFAPLPAASAAIHARLKAEFDPQRIFNPGRLVADL